MHEAQTTARTDLLRAMLRMGRNARSAARELARASREQRNRALEGIATALREQTAQILGANEQDLEGARRRGLSGAMLDRLALDTGRVDAMANAVAKISTLDDPVGKVMDRWIRPNGLEISRVRVPLGVIGIIYESRPNVTADAAALCIKSANAVILRGGSESHGSSRAIHACVTTGLAAAGLPVASVQMVPTTSRDAVGMLLADMRDYVDVIVPRGGKRLIARVQADARVPVIGHLEGICHVYVHESADPVMARDVVLNAKMRRPGICGAAETLLIDRSCLDSHFSAIADALIGAGCEIRGDETICLVEPRAVAAQPEDWDTEYLDSILAVKTVAGVEEAVDHIERHGSGHTEAIIAEDTGAVEQFRQLDSAIVLHNASTQFADGGEFGMGAEIGIATGRIHARGPVGVEQLTSYKYLVEGSGQIRP